MLALGMLAYLKWIKWLAWLWMSRIMRYVWVRCWCQLHIHCQNCIWNIHCSISSSAVSTASHCLPLNCCSCCFTFIFLFSVSFSFHLFVHRLVIRFYLPSFLFLFLSSSLSCMHNSSGTHHSNYRRYECSIIWCVETCGGYLQLPDTASTCKCRSSQLCFIWMMFNM